MTQVSDLSESEAQQLMSKLQQIIDISNAQAKSGMNQSHEIYSLARDCRDLITFDAVSREMVQKLSQSDLTVVLGQAISNQVKNYADRNEKIKAIKQLREETTLSLYEAKQVVESYMTQNSTW